MKKIFSILAFCTISVFTYSQILIDDGPIIISREAQPDVDYTVHGNSWDHRILTYWFSNGTTDIVGDDEKIAIKTAMSLWENATDILFFEESDPIYADIIIMWGVGDHGCGYPFDGMGGILAHSFFPPPNGEFAGDIHFDDDENWTIEYRSNSNQPLDLITIAAHELGHSLGLRHSSVETALMYAYYTGSHRYLDQDDIDGITSIYGETGTFDFISGPFTLCVSNTTYSINNPPASAMVTWSCSNNISYVSGQGTNNCVFKSNTNGLGWIKATLVSTTDTLEITKTVSVGLRATFSGSTTVLLNGTGTWTAYPTCGNEPYTYRWFLRKEGTGMAATMVGDESTLTLWSLPVLKSLSPDTSQNDNEDGISGDPTKQPSTRTYFRLYLRVYDANTMFETPEQRITAYGDVDLISRYLKSGENVEGLANDIAGESMVYEQATGYDSPGLSLTLAPNPAGEWVDITVDGIDEYGAGYRVEFVNSMSRTVKTLRLDGSYNRISIGDMANGYYVVRIISGKNVASKILLVE